MPGPRVPPSAGFAVRSSTGSPPSVGHGREGRAYCRVVSDAEEPRLARGIRSVSRVTLGAVLSLGEQAATLVTPPDDDGGAPRALPSGAPEPDPRWRHLLVGTAFAAEDRVVEVSLLVSRVTDRVAPIAGWLIDSPLVGPARRRVETTIDGLIDRGRTEEAIGRAQAAQLFNNGLEKAVASPKIDEVVGGVVGRVLDPVLDQALPQVFTTLQDQPEQIVELVNAIVADALDPILKQALPKVLGDLGSEPELLLPLVTAIVGEALDPILAEALPKVLDDIGSQPEMMLPLVESLIGEALEPVLHQALPQVIEVLNEDPEAIRSLLRDQSTGMAADMAHTVRTRAVTADDRVDRLVRRITRRKPPELGSGSQSALPSGEEP